MAKGRSDVAILIALAVIAAAAEAVVPLRSDRGPSALLPGRPTGRGYVTSNACQACHPAQYDTWHRSFHRTMTQAATPATVQAPFDGAALGSGDETWRFERRGSELWAELPDPFWYDQPRWLMRMLDDRWPDRPPTIRAPVVMSTGSHHMQTYWVRRPATPDAPLPPDDGALVQVPWVWLIDEGRWVPNQDSFLTPPSASPGGVARWNANCSQCHSVGTEPGTSPGGARFATRTVELGIACEACHGPAERHVDHYRSPVRRYLRYLRLARGDDPPDPTIVNPAKLDAARSSEVCGQCHSFGVWLDEDAYLSGGIRFTPGQELAAQRRVFSYADDREEPLLRSMLESDSLALASRFWPDGTIRVAGREYNGVVASSHHGGSELTCLSCHSLHEYRSTDTQLREGADGDGACLGCHETYATDVARHTRHEAGSPGSECMGCHMPRTTYGLFDAMRSHRIDSPSISTARAGGRPNACNLCHLDQTLEWTARHLVDWYGSTVPALDAEERAVAAGPLWVLRGDAVVRTVAAWHMGSPAAREAAGDRWMVPYLAQLLTDPFAATRRVAYRSLSTLPGFGDFQYDYVGSPTERAERADEALRLWVAAGGGPRSAPDLLFDAAGRPDAGRWLDLFGRRDKTALTIRE